MTSLDVIKDLEKHLNNDPIQHASEVNLFREILAASTHNWRKDIQDELDRIIFLVSKMYYLGKLIESYTDVWESKVMELETVYNKLKLEADGLLYSYEINRALELEKVINFRSDLGGKLC